jgi:hypothetical protein
VNIENLESSSGLPHAKIEVDSDEDMINKFTTSFELILDQAVNSGSLDKVPPETSEETIDCAESATEEQIEQERSTDETEFLQSTATDKDLGDDLASDDDENDSDYFPSDVSIHKNKLLLPSYRTIYFIKSSPCTG